MADHRAAQMMAYLRGETRAIPDGKTEAPGSSPTKLSGAGQKLREGLQRQHASAPVASESEDFQTRVNRRVHKLVSEGRRPDLARDLARGQVLTEIAKERADEERREVYEAMIASTEAEPAVLAERAKTNASRPLRVRRGPDGRPVPGTSVNDLIADGARNLTTERLLVAYFGGADDNDMGQEI